MVTLKNNLNQITDDGESLIKDNVKLLGLKVSESFAKLLGIISTIFIISTLILIIIVFCSFVLAGWINDLLDNDYWGFFIVSGLYVITIATLLIVVKKTGKPLFTGMFVGFILPLLNIETEGAKTIEGLNAESENVKNKIDSNKKTLIAYFQLLKYTVFEELLREISSLLFSKKKGNEKSENDEGNKNDSN